VVTTIRFIAELPAPCLHQSTDHQPDPWNRMYIENLLDAEEAGRTLRTMSATLFQKRQGSGLHRRARLRRFGARRRQPDRRSRSRCGVARGRQRHGLLTGRGPL